VAPSRRRRFDQAMVADGAQKSLEDALTTVIPDALLPPQREACLSATGQFH
jgi:hypothetical protein